MYTYYTILYHIQQIIIYKNKEIKEMHTYTRNITLYSNIYIHTHIYTLLFIYFIFLYIFFCIILLLLPFFSYKYICAS